MYMIPDSLRAGEEKSWLLVFFLQSSEPSGFSDLPPVIDTTPQLDLMERPAPAS